MKPVPRPRRRALLSSVAIVIYVATSLGASPRPHAVGYPPDTLVVFHTDSRFRWILHDGAVVDGGFGDGVPDVSTVGLAATSDGNVLEAFSGFREVPDGFIAISGIDVLSPEGDLEAHLLFNDHHFDGIALTEGDDVWVSDSFTRSLLQVDMASGAIVREIALGGVENLHDIDANNFFYLTASAGAPARRVIRVRNPDGSHVRDIDIDTEDRITSGVRIDSEGHVLVAGSRILSPLLYKLLPDGQVVDTVELEGVSSHSFALTPDSTAWFGTPDFDPPAVAEIAADGTTLRAISLPDLGLGYGTVGDLAFTRRHRYDLWRMPSRSHSPANMALAADAARSPAVPPTSELGSTKESRTPSSRCFTSQASTDRYAESVKARRRRGDPVSPPRPQRGVISIMRF